MNENSHTSHSLLTSIGLPAADDYELPSSPLQFLDGSHYALEIASVQNPRIMRSVLLACREFSIRPVRLIETLGITRLTNAELREMVQVAAEAGVGLVLSVGPRATYDTSASARSPQGARIGYRLRGADNLRHALDDVMRATDLGVRGILVYDEGLLCVLAQLRDQGSLPRTTHLKVSVHCGHGNPASLRMLEAAGASSVNVVADLQLPMLAACRRACRVPIDIHTDTPASSGGFLRTHEVPEIVRVASPVFLKAGAISSPTHAHTPTDSDVRARVQQAARVVEHLSHRAPWARAATIDTPGSARVLT